VHGVETPEREQTYHYLRATASTRLPRHHAFVHVATGSTKVGGHYEHRLTAAAAIFRDAPKGRPVKESAAVFASGRELFKSIDQWAPDRSRAVLWCHNVGHAARALEMFVILPRDGWELTGWNMSPQGTWLVWVKQGRTLTVVDVAAVFPMTLGELAKHFGTPAAAGPGTSSQGTGKAPRPLEHAQLIRDAVVAYLEWLEDEDLGDWQLTGTGQAFTAFRRRFLSHRMLVHWDEDAREAERRAQWAGRTEAYFHGTKHHTRIEEWDLASAYPRVAATCDVPVELVRTLPPGADIWRWLERGGYAVLAVVDVSTATPLVPAENRSRILWPVGEFRTTLWDPELRLLREQGGTVAVERAWVYRTAPALQDYATYLLEMVASRDMGVPAWKKAVAQHWGRAFIGRFSMRYPDWEFLGRMPRHGCRWWTQRDLQTGEASELVHIGHQLWETRGTVDWAHSMPAVTGWIASKVRAILTQLLLELGERKALYADTDSVLVEGRHHRAVATLARRHPEWCLRVKRAWDRVTILGPRSIITGERVRVSGVPVRAVPLPDGSVSGEVWESLRVALLNRAPTRVKVTPRRWKLRDLDHRRVVGDDGWTEPVRLPAPP
jgi:hypothetical protein